MNHQHNNQSIARSRAPAAELLNPAEAAVAFWREGYMAVEGYLPEAMAALAARYALMQYVNNPQPEVARGGREAQVEGAHSMYGDPLAESLLDLATADVGTMVGRRLTPTYAFYRVYRAGDALKPHTDRIACEISASLCLGFQTDAEGTPWPLGIRTLDDNPTSVEVEQQPGDIVIYQGCQCIHWRRPLRGGPDAWQAQVFLHWVDSDGPYADLCRLDCRPALGLDHSHRDPARARAAETVDTQEQVAWLGRLRQQYLVLAGELQADFEIVAEPEDNDR